MTVVHSLALSFTIKFQAVKLTTNNRKKLGFFFDSVASHQGYDREVPLGGRCSPSAGTAESAPDNRQVP